MFKTICNKDCFDGKYYKRGDNRTFSDEKEAEDHPHFNVIGKPAKTRKKRSAPKTVAPVEENVVSTEE